MAFATLSNLKSALGGGSRPNLFEIAITFPTAISTSGLSSNEYLLCKAAAVPAMTIGSIEVPVRGRSVKVPGDRSFAEWTPTFLSDATFSIRKKMEAWVDWIKLSDFSAADLRNTGSTSGQDYYGSATVKQLDEAGKALRVYQLELAFPTDISTMDLSYDTTDALQEFTVTFQYSYFSASTPTATA